MRHTRTLGDLFTDQGDSCINGTPGQSEPSHQARCDQAVGQIMVDWSGVRWSDDYILENVARLLAQAYTQGRLDAETGR